LSHLGGRSWTRSSSSATAHSLPGTLDLPRTGRHRSLRGSVQVAGAHQARVTAA
jgi:hypothetical protein